MSVPFNLEREKVASGYQHAGSQRLFLVSVQSRKPERGRDDSPYICFVCVQRACKLSAFGCTFQSPCEKAAGLGQAEMEP